MGKKIRTAIAAVLAFCMMGISASADALGTKITEYEVNNGISMKLAKGTYWTGSDYTVENYISYSPNAEVVPIVAYGQSVTKNDSFSSMAQQLENQGWHVIGGINGDYYVMADGEPLGVVISEGNIITSDGGLNALGFTSDGTSIISRPNMSMKAEVRGTEYLISKINKKRDDNYLSLLTDEYGTSTKSASSGVDIICSPSQSNITPNCELTLKVEEVKKSTGAVEIPSGKMVLSLADSAPQAERNVLNSLSKGETIKVTVSSDAAWNQAEYAVGSLYKLVTNGKVESGLDNSLQPRTAAGIREDGSLVLYTVDGRQTGYSVGATMTQLAQRMIELGCTEATIMDGGGSTSMNAIYLGDESLSQINEPSGGSQRAVSNYIMLATKMEPTGQAAQLATYPLNTVMLKGATRTFETKTADIYGYPASWTGGINYTVSNNLGTIQGAVLKAENAGKGTVTASSGDLISASVPVEVVETPDSIAILNEETKSTVSSLQIKAGTSVDLTATAVSNHISLITEDTCFNWSCDSSIGKIDKNGVFTSSDNAGKGTIYASAGSTEASLPVTVIKTGTFDDVSTDAWYYGPVEYVYEKGLMAGTGGGKFSPEAELSRAMVATILWSREGKPTPASSYSFSDVAGDKWYAQSMAWAKEQEILAGYGDGTGGPDRSITRQELAVMLLKYETYKYGDPGDVGSLEKYTDKEDVAPWAKKAMGWCVDKGCISGMTKTTIGPQGTATRAQCATILYRYDMIHA